MWKEIFNPDVFLFVMLFGFTMFVWWVGVIHAIGSAVGTIVGAYVATHYNNALTDWVLSQVQFPEGTAHVLVFFITFFLVNRLIGFVFWLIDHSLNFTRFIPFLKSINRMFGAVFGFVEGMLVLGLGLAYLSTFPFGSGFASYFSHSAMAPWLIDSAAVLFPLLPEAWEQVGGLFDHV